MAIEDSRSTEIDELLASIRDIADRYYMFLSRNPSPKLAHYSRHLGEVAAALQAERERWLNDHLKAEQRKAEAEANRVIREYNANDRFAAAQLIKGGKIKSIDELEAWRERQRARDTGQSISDQLADLSAGTAPTAPPASDDDEWPDPNDRPVNDDD